MIYGVLYVDTSQKFQKNPRFWEKSISTNFRKFRKYFYRGGVTSPQKISLVNAHNFREGVRGAYKGPELTFENILAPLHNKVIWGAETELGQIIGGQVIPKMGDFRDTLPPQTCVSRGRG